MNRRFAPLEKAMKPCTCGDPLCPDRAGVPRSKASELYELLDSYGAELPAWANWAVVNEIGDLWVFEFPPVHGADGWSSPDGEESCIVEGIKSTALDNVLIRI